jgi:hypothetical protein
MLLFLFLVLFLAVLLGVIRALLEGTLTLYRVGEPVVAVPLRQRPFLLLPTDNLTGVHGRLLVAGIPFTRRIHIWILRPGCPRGSGTLRPGGERYVGGVWVTHDTKAQQDDEPENFDLDSAKL